MDGIDVCVTDWRDAPVRLPAGTSEAAVGDVHGMSGHLSALLSALDGLAPDAHLTLLGDLVDRGPDSLGALRIGTAAVLARGPGRATLLPGNHEQMMLGALREPQSGFGGAFLTNGGMWLMDHWDGRSDGRAVLRGLIGGAASDLLDQGGALHRAAPGARMCRAAGSLVLVHAGVDPAAPDPAAWADASDPTRDQDMHPLWIREPFLDGRGPYGGGAFVVHRHTHERGVTRSDGTRAAVGDHRRDGWRLGLDGGSSVTGTVAAAIVEDGRYRVLTARAAGTRGACATPPRGATDRPGPRDSRTRPGG